MYLGQSTPLGGLPDLVTGNVSNSEVAHNPVGLSFQLELVTSDRSIENVSDQNPTKWGSPGTELCDVEVCVTTSGSINCDLAPNVLDTACVKLEGDMENTHGHCDFGCILSDALRMSTPLLRMDSDEPRRDLDYVLCEYVSPLGTTVKVFDDCVIGTCSCVYYVGNCRNQLKPCRFASILILGGLDREKVFSDLLDNVVDGFPIVDAEVLPYECVNYNSILTPDNKSAMDIIVRRELKEGMISISEGDPQCVHALGAVPKASGGMRPITDCSRPTGNSVKFFVIPFSKSLNIKAWMML